MDKDQQQNDGKTTCMDAATDKVRDEIVELAYGGIPPEPDALRFEKHLVKGFRLWKGEPKLHGYRIHCEVGDRVLTLNLKLYFPQGEGPFPVLVNGDGCWRYATDEVIQSVLAQNYAFVSFDRTELARDFGGRIDGVDGWDKREGGLYDLYPDMHFGAISAWAWGYHRVLDLLAGIPFIDMKKVAVTGHSRGGKAVLLAGLTDPRISLINDNASGAGGSALYREVGADGETLGNIIHEFPHWFGPELASYVGREEDLPFDQHNLLACLAPRPVLITYAKGDLWSNPSGMIRSVEAAREICAAQGKADHLVYHLREGGHAHLAEDWQVLLAFMHQIIGA